MPCDLYGLFKCSSFNDTGSCADYLVSVLHEWTFVALLVNDQCDAQIPFYVFFFIFNSLHVSSTLCSSSGETNCVNTTSGNCHSVLVAMSCHSQPAHNTVTHTEWQLPEVVLTQFVSPDDERDVLKTCRVNSRNKYIERNLCVMLVIYQESLHDARSTECKI
jgi:hypothetical protein